jgi:hypothetical protein
LPDQQDALFLSPMPFIYLDRIRIQVAKIKTSTSLLRDARGESDIARSAPRPGIFIFMLMGGRLLETVS